MTQYRVSEETEDRLRKFCIQKLGRVVRMRGGNPGGALTFEDALAELLTEAGF